MWLLEGQPAPDHSTIARFRKEYLEDAVEDLFYQMVQYLHEIGEVKFENIFIDGTKIEANANRYTFVWKKAVNKNEAKMFEKIKSCLEELNLMYMTSFTVSKEYLAADLGKDKKQFSSLNPTMLFRLALLFKGKKTRFPSIGYTYLKSGNL